MTNFKKKLEDAYKWKGKIIRTKDGYCDGKMDDKETFLIMKTAQLHLVHNYYPGGGTNFYLPEDKVLALVIILKWFEMINDFLEKSQQYQEKQRDAAPEYSLIFADVE